MRRFSKKWGLMCHKVSWKQAVNVFRFMTMETTVIKNCMQKYYPHRGLYTLFKISMHAIISGKHTHFIEALFPIYARLVHQIKLPNSKFPQHSSQTSQYILTAIKPPIHSTNARTSRVQFVVGHVKPQFADQMEECGCPETCRSLYCQLYFC